MLWRIALATMRPVALSGVMRLSKFRMVFVPQAYYVAVAADCLIQHLFCAVKRYESLCYKGVGVSYREAAVVPALLCLQGSKALYGLYKSVCRYASLFHYSSLLVASADSLYSWLICISLFFMALSLAITSALRSSPVRLSRILLAAPSNVIPRSFTSP